MRVRYLWIIGLGLLMGCGHGSEIPRASVSGKVSYQGQPIADGTIRFVPIKGTKGPVAGAEIKDGVYQVVVAGGVPLGTHRVEIQAFQTLAQDSSQPRRPGRIGDLPAKRQYLPTQYNRQSTLEATIDSKGEKIQDFDLK